jgi:hypothetical protein
MSRTYGQSLAKSTSEICGIPEKNPTIQYNSALAFASVGANVSMPPVVGPYVFRLNGEVRHLITPLGEIESPRYGNLYFIDTAQATEFRANFGMY